MGAHFLCCLPIRLGAFLITLGTTITSGAVAASMWYLLTQHGDLLNTTPLKVSVIFLGVSQTLIALFALGGFWGVMRKKLGLIRSFVSFYAYQIGINMGINIVFLVFLYKRSPEEWAKRCEAIFTDKDMQDSCKDQINASKIGTIVSIVISFLFQCYCIWIVSQYGKKLAKKENKSRTFALDTASYARTAKNPHEAEAFVAPKTDYAYTDANNSFGHTDASHRV